MSSKRKVLKIIFLGGIDEIGKNMTAIEYGDDIIVIDCGLIFPQEDMLGIDLVIPDITYLVKNQEKIRGFLFTHGHEDHIGATPYVLRQVSAPLYGTQLTLGLIENKLREHKLKDVSTRQVAPGQSMNIGCFKVDFMRVSHSIAGALGLAIHTPKGIIVHTGDFKVDYTPIDGEVMNLSAFAELGSRGVLALLSDSTNAERAGFTMSESHVGEVLVQYFEKAKGRIFVATFASNIHRIQQIIDIAAMLGRKVCISGRSMVNISNLAFSTGYLNIPPDMQVDMDELHRYQDDELVIITTGSQGEQMSGLARMATSEHRKIEIRQGDTVILSSTPIPGNEKLVSRIINQLFKKGANVIYSALADVHVSGHACQEELKLMYTLIKPQYFIPVHGEYRHLRQHAMLIESLGMNPQNIITPSLGCAVEFVGNEMQIGTPVPAGSVMVDGLGIGDVGNVVLRDRKHLSQDGLMVAVVTISANQGMLVADPEIISRGFIYMRESEEMITQAKALVQKVVNECAVKGKSDWGLLKGAVRDALRDFVYQKTKRNPMILPVIVEV